MCHTVWHISELIYVINRKKTVATKERSMRFADVLIAFAAHCLRTFIVMTHEFDLDQLDNVDV